MLHPRPATAEQTERLWPVVRSARLMDTEAQLVEYRETGPWRVRVTERGDAALLGVWRAHLDYLALRGVWGSAQSVVAFVDDACGLARAQGMAHVLSPLVPMAHLGPYEDAGMRPLEAIVAIQGAPGDVARPPLPDGVSLRLGTLADIPELVELDACCFDEFWRYGACEFEEFSATERLAIAETPARLAPDGRPAIVGYTLTTASRGAATLARLGVHPDARRRGLGAALLGDAAAWAQRAQAATISLCTQESNSASRSLYSSAGLREVEERYTLAVRDALTGGIRS